MPGFASPRRSVQLTLLAVLLPCPVAGASAFTLDQPRPPALLDYATDTPQRQSSVTAWSTFNGSRLELPCSDSGAFWACRKLFDSGDAFESKNRDSATSTSGSAVTASRGNQVFDSTAPSPLKVVDITPATSDARAQTGFGSNKAEATAWNGRYWTENRIESAWDPSMYSIDSDTTSGAAAWSTYTELLTPSVGGQITLQFGLTQHVGTAQPLRLTGFPGDDYEGYGSGSLLIQVFNLDVSAEYWQPDSSFPIEGPLIVGSGEISRTADEGSGKSFLDLVFDVVAGNRYVLVSQLAVVAENNASADFYGTASLERILVTPGMTVDIGSGTAYNIAAVPEPETYAMLLAGLGLVGFAAHRRRRI